MQPSSRAPFLAGAIVFTGLSITGFVTRAVAETVTSPGGGIVADVSVVSNRLTYTVTAGGTTILAPSPLGVVVNGVDLGENVMISSSSVESADTSFPSRHGVKTQARDHYQAKRFQIQHPGGITYTLNLRAYDNGVAFRYELTHSGQKNVTQESSGFILPAGTLVWSQAGTGVYEDIYSSADISSVAVNANMGPPLTGKLPGVTGYIALTHTAPGEGFGNPFTRKTADASNRKLQTVYPLNGDGTTGASTAGNALTPWNVVMHGANLEALVNNDMVECLAPAPDPVLYPDGAATAWARPGRSVWDWMSRFPGGITAANSKLDSYWANQLGWEYNTIDEGWGNWNGGNPWPQVAEVTAHAAPLDVKILLWVRSADLATQSQRTAFFTKVRDNGASGFKADFFDFNSVSPAAKERVKLVEDILKEAAAFQLVANLHGTGKPLGQFRTYPNLLNIEAVYGKESFPADGTTAPLPFTRLLAGPADYTPLGLQGRLKENLTVAHEIATMVSFHGPLITLAERSDRMAMSAFSPVIRTIPNLWDETRVLPGTEIGQSAGLARRKGEMWYVAIHNADTARNWQVALSFLTAGTTYQAQIVRDNATELEYRTVTSATTLQAATAAEGGFVVKMVPVGVASVDTLPFITSFGTGRGTIHAEEGVMLSTGAWASSFLADRLPDEMWKISTTGTPLVASLDHTDAWQGGSSLKVAGTLDAPNDLALYRTNLPVTSATKLALAYKRGLAAASGVQVGLVFSDAPSAPVFLPVGAASGTGWAKVEFPLSAHAGRTLSSVFLRFSSGSTVAGYSVKIGQLAIFNTPLPTVGAPVNLQATGATYAGLDALGVNLAWTAPAGGAARYSVYQKNPLTGERRWLGITAGTAFTVSHAPRLGQETQAVFQVRSMGTAGVTSGTVEVVVPLAVMPLLNNPLSGAVIGTAGSYENSGNTRDKVFDGDVTTFFDSPNGDGSWAGIDLGATGASRVAALRYYPRDSWSGRMNGGVFQGANQPNFSDAVTLATVNGAPPEGVHTLVSINNAQSFRYLRYLSPNGGWGNIAEVKFFGPGTLPPPQGTVLTGSVIGTAGSFQNSNSTRDKVFDGDTNTFFDAPNGDGAWAGIDLGATGASRVSEIRFFPRANWAGRMNGGLFQGANQADFSDAVTLFPLVATPPEGVYSSVTVSATGTFRYLRYLSPNGGWCNVAEVQFHAPPALAAPGGVEGKRSATSAILKWDPVATAESYRVKRATVSGGPYTVVADGVAGTTHTDTGLAGASRYFYVVSALKTPGVESANSMEVEALDAYAQWAALLGLPSGDPGAAFGADADGDGIPNGVEYLVPGGLTLGMQAGSAGLAAEARDDGFSSVILFSSPDLVVWTEVAGATRAPSESLPGFIRITYQQEGAGSGARFYRLAASR